MKKNYLLLLIASFCVISLSAQQSFTFETMSDYNDPSRQEKMRIVSDGTEVDGIITIATADATNQNITLGVDFVIFAGRKYTITGNFTKLKIGKAEGISKLDITGLTDLKEFVGNRLYSVEQFSVSGLANLEKLEISTSKLDLLEVGTLKKLKNLTIGRAKLTELALAQLGNLEILNLSNNPLKTLNVSTLKKLTTLSCNAIQLTELDVSALTALESLNLAGNELTELSVNGLPQLKSLTCGRNPLSSLNVTGTSDNLKIDCSNSKLLDIIGFKPTHKFSDFMAAGKQAIFVEMVSDASGGFKSKNKYSVESGHKLTLEEGAGLSFDNGYFKAAEAGLGVAVFVTELAEGEELIGEITFDTGVEDQSFSFLSANAGKLKFGDSQIIGDTIQIRKKGSADYVTYNIDEEIPIDNNFEYEVKGKFLKLNWAGVYFKKIDLGELKWLKQLVCGMNNEFTELDLKQLSALEELNCTYTSLTTLKLPETSMLKKLSCNANAGLSSIENLNNAVELVSLSCEQTIIDSLDISALKNLQYLNFSQSKVKSLTMPTSTTGSALKELICAFNQLTTLDLSAAKDLESLNCSNNKIAKLNISGLTKLENLECSNNVLRALDLSSLPSDADVVCSHNQLLDVVPSENNIASFDASNQLVTVPMKANESKPGFKSIQKYDVNKDNLELISPPTELSFEDGYFVSSEEISANLAFKTKLNDSMTQFIEGTLKFETYQEPEIFSFSSAGTTFKLGTDTEIASGEIKLIAEDGTEKTIEIGDEVVIEANKKYQVSGAFIKLDCQNNLLKTLDVTSMKNLTELDFSYNEIRAISLSGAENLETFKRGDNPLDSLDLSGLKKLGMVMIYNGQLSYLNLTGVSVNHINAHTNHLINIVGGKNPNAILQFIENQLVSVPMKVNPAGVGYISEKSYDVAADSLAFDPTDGITFEDGYFKSTEKINEIRTFTTNLGRTDDKKLEGKLRFITPESFTFISAGNKFKLGTPSDFKYEFAISPSVKDGEEEVNIILGNKEYSIEAGKKYTVTGGFSELDCSKNSLTALNLSKLTTLKELDCQDNQLSTLDVSGLTQLNKLNCNINRLCVLDISGLVNLNKLYCANNQLFFIKGVKDVINGSSVDFKGENQHVKVVLKATSGDYTSIEKYQKPENNNFAFDDPVPEDLTLADDYFKWTGSWPGYSVSYNFTSGFSNWGANALKGTVEFNMAERTISGKKILQNKTLVADQFEFELYFTNYVPSTLVATARNTADGDFTLAITEYLFPGNTYSYLLKERNTGLEGITYDNKVYTVTVEVPALASGLTEKVTIKDGDGIVIDVPTFTNTYSDPSTGVELVKKENKINYYPNPVRENLQIDSEEIITELSVFDISGKLLIREKVDNTQVRISTEDLNPGMYILRVITAQGANNFKIIKQ